MRVYIRGYLQRQNEIAIAVICCVVAILLSYGLFYDQLNKISFQLSSYNAADYSYVYVLNYGIPLENIAIFPDADAQIYSDEERTHRLTVSSIMKSSNANYFGNYLEVLSDLQTNEIILTENVAKKYALNVGDFLYVEYPYTNNIIKKRVVGITATDYDFLHPNIDNDIGVLYLGYEKDYEENIQCKYVVFSVNSQVETLAQYPQVISSVVNKSENKRYVFNQGAYILIFQFVFILVSFIIANIAFFSKSQRRLKRCYLKGMKRTQITFVSLLEKILFSFVPDGLLLWLISSCVNTNSIFARVYFTLPLLIIGMGSVVIVLFDMKRYKRS